MDAVRCPNPRCGAPAPETLLRCEKPYDLDGGAHLLRFRFAHCKACGLAFVDPQPDARVLGAFYPDEYAYWDVPPRATLGERFKFALAAWRHPRGGGPLSAMRRGVASAVERLAGRDASFSLGIPAGLPRESRILDFGFGAGGFLLALRAFGFTDLWGYDVEGNQRNRIALEAAGVRAFTGGDLLPLPDRSFDCIRLEHVLEHLPDPVGRLRELRGKLRREGLLVLTVPSIHAWEPLEALARSPHLDHLQLPIHLWHHSMRSFADFIAAAGFDVVQVRRLRPYSYLSALARVDGAS